MRKLLYSAVLAFALAGSAQAAVIASSTFNTSNEGWRVGEFTGINPGALATYDAGGQLITTVDAAANVGFLAPVAYLGNKSAAFGGTFAFQVSDIANDNPLLYAPISLIGGGLTLYAQGVLGPGTALTPYSVTLLGANFKTNNPFGAGGTVATDAQLMTVLADLDQLSVLADWNTGDDFTRLDNVVLTSGVTAVPEPGTWSMLLLGFAAVGYSLRRRPARRTQIA